MKRYTLLAAFALASFLSPLPMTSAAFAAQTSAPDAARNLTRSRMSSILAIAGARSDVNVAFRQSTKNPYNFVGTMTGMVNCNPLEIVWSVTKSDTIGLRAYCHYNGGYINVGRAKDAYGLMRRLLLLNDENFLYWGADDSGDVFTAYTFTLESGFPDDGITIVARSLRNTDKFIGQLRPMIDGSPDPGK